MDHTDNLHVHQFKETVVLPTCKEPGYTLYTCDCGYEHRTNFKPAAAHSYQVTEATEATCDAPGSMTEVCTCCGEQRTKVIPPLGHDYSHWVVKTYPTCQEPGVKIRKCNRCSVTEEQSIAPTGHKCAPGSEQYENGKLVAFFCENCGQMIENRPAPKESGWLPTKIAIIAAALFTFMDFALMVTLVLSPRYQVWWTAPWTSFGMPVVELIVSIALFMNVKRIKQASRYPRWLGAATLYHVAYYVNLMLINLADPNITGYILYPLLCCIPFVLMTILFFAGVKKKRWPVFVILTFVTLMLFIGTAVIADQISYLTRFGREINLFDNQRIMMCLCVAMTWTQWAVVMFPAKRTAVQKK